MNATPAAILVLLALIVSDAAALSLGVLAARDNARHGNRSTSNGAFWRVVGVYLGVVLLLGLGLVETVSMSMWLVIGALSWQFIFLVGVRWLVQSGARHRARASDRSRSLELFETSGP